MIHTQFSFDAKLKDYSVCMSENKMCCINNIHCIFQNTLDHALERGVLACNTHFNNNKTHLGG